MQHTTIEWVFNPDGSRPGWAWNPITGCLNGCEYCYARRLANGRLKSIYLANKNIAVPADFERLQRKMIEFPALQDPFYPRLWEDRLVAGDKFLKSARKPLGIFPCDMSDWCGIGIPESWSNWILEMARRYPQHRFYLLTKQPQNLPDEFPSNCWIGVSVDGTDNAPLGRMLYTKFDRVKAKIKFISFEPLLADPKLDYRDLEWTKVGWVIIGACTGRKYELLELCQKWNIEGVNQGTRLMRYRGNLWTLQPNELWVSEIIEACNRANIPYFLKDNLRPLLGDNLVQDMPKGVGMEKEKVI